VKTITGEEKCLFTNTDARIVRQFLKPLFHLYLMPTMLSARSVKAKMWRSRFLRSQAAWPEAAVVHRLELFPVVPLNPVSPEHDFRGLD